MGSLKTFTDTKVFFCIKITVAELFVVPLRGSLVISWLFLHGFAHTCMHILLFSYVDIGHLIFDFVFKGRFCN